jgi:hypothetical protein
MFLEKLQIFAVKKSTPISAHWDHPGLSDWGISASHARRISWPCYKVGFFSNVDLLLWAFLNIQKSPVWSKNDDFNSLAITNGD